MTQASTPKGGLAASADTTAKMEATSQIGLAEVANREPLCWAAQSLSPNEPIAYFDGKAAGWPTAALPKELLL